MSAGNIAVPTMTTTRLPDPVPVAEYDACPVTELLRTVFPTVPPGVEYGLTTRGRGVLKPLGELATWVVASEAG
jgi:hypothetical protein